MKPPEATLRGLAQQWLEKAAADLGAAEQLRSQGGRFRVLVRYQVEFTKTHDIAKLLERLATADSSVAESLRGADVLTPFGVEARYPGDAPEILVGGETAAFEIACQVRDAVVSSLQPYLEGK